MLTFGSMEDINKKINWGHTEILSDEEIMDLCTSEGFLDCELALTLFLDREVCKEFIKMGQNSFCNCKKYGIANPACVIPCGVQLELFTDNLEVNLRLKLFEAVEEHLEQQVKTK